MIRRPPPRQSAEFPAYLRSLHGRAQELAVTLHRLHGNINHTMHNQAAMQNWPALLSQFALLSSQIQTLYDELNNNPQSWSARLHSSNSLIQPCVPSFNPSAALRIKPLPEWEEVESRAYEGWKKSEEKDYSALQLRDQINDYNEACAKLARLAQTAAALPPPRAAPLVTPGVASAAATAVPSPTLSPVPPVPSSAAAAGPGTAAVRRGAAVLDDAAQARHDESELQRTLTAMFLGTQLRQTQQLTQHSHSPTPIPHQHQHQRSMTADNGATRPMQHQPTTPPLMHGRSSPSPQPPQSAAAQSRPPMHGIAQPPPPASR